GKFSGLLDVADDFSNMTRSLAQGDVLGAARSGSSMMSGAGRGLAAGLGISTGPLLVGGSVAAAAALSVPAAATWEKQVGRASKTALDDSAGYTKGDLSAGMLSTLMDVKGINQQDLIDAVGRAGSLGYTNEEAIQAATVGSKAGAAFEIETGEAMRMLGVVNQMWAEQSELVGGNIVMMEKAGSAVNVLGNKYASTESNILQFLSEAGGLAKTWNMDVAETAAIGSLLETVNIKASEGETMFRSALNAGIFQKRALTEDQAKAFKKAGVRPRGEMGYDIAGSMLGVSGKEYQEMLNTNMADTMLATVDAVLEKAGGDNSLAQQMAEAAFGSYGMGFLKLGGQRGNLAEMTAEA
ncbi:MAG TPA: phage tail tape measure protein, partial [Methanothrix sp.]|nr:phage tail tape measure protein [Methanothrix sp.]